MYAARVQPGARREGGGKGVGVGGSNFGNENRAATGWA